MSLKHPIISFSRSAQKETLALLDISLDSEGYLLENKTSTRVLAFDDGKPIHKNEFGGVMKGKSGQIIFFKSDLPSLVGALGEIERRDTRDV
jgi:hypothetical protein